MQNQRQVLLQSPCLLKAAGFGAGKGVKQLLVALQSILLLFMELCHLSLLVLLRPVPSDMGPPHKRIINVRPIVSLIFSLERNKAT